MELRILVDKYISLDVAKRRFRLVLDAVVEGLDDAATLQEIACRIGAFSQIIPKIDVDAVSWLPQVALGYALGTFRNAMPVSATQYYQPQTVHGFVPTAVTRPLENLYLVLSYQPANRNYIAGNYVTQNTLAGTIHWNLTGRLRLSILPRIRGTRAGAMSPWEGGSTRLRGSCIVFRCRLGTDIGNGRYAECFACDLFASLGDLIRKKGRSRIGAAKGGIGIEYGRRTFVGGALARAGLPAATGTMMPGKAGAAPADGSADTVFRNGAVYTVAPEQPWAETVAGKRIVAVGTNDDIKRFIGTRTEIIDLDGRMLMPGFVEGHTHPFVGAFLTTGVDLQYPTREEALDAIREYAMQNPRGTLGGFGWRMDMFPNSGPTRQELDRIVPDRSVLLFAIDGHSMWVNSKALEPAGITKNTPDPIPNFS